jgi:hypothetical protein
MDLLFAQQRSSLMRTGCWLTVTPPSSRTLCGQSFNLILIMLRRGGTNQRVYPPNDTQTISITV